MPLQRDTPVVVFVVDHGNVVTSSSPLLEPDGRAPDAWQMAVLNRVIPRLDGVALLGAVRFPLDSTSATATACDAHDHLVVRPTAHGAQAVLAYLNGYELSNGGGPIGATVTNVTPEVLAAGDARAPHWFVLTNDGGGGCGDHTAVSTVTAGIIAHARDLGVQTLVFGLQLGTFAPNDSDALNLDLYAVAGGVPRPGPFQFYPLDDPSQDDAALADGAFDAEIIRPFYCRVHTATAPSHLEGYVLDGRSAGRIAPDPTRTDGWDWTDAARGELEVFGPSCDRVVSSTSDLVLISPHATCEL